jgi:hypothetical protein
VIDLDTDRILRRLPIAGAPTTARTVPGPPRSGIRRTPPLVSTAPFTIQ